MFCLPAVNRLGVGGKAVIPLRVALGGPELLQGVCQWVRCTLQLTYVGHRFAVSAAPTAPLFDPPLALQVGYRHHNHLPFPSVQRSPTLANNLSNQRSASHTDHSCVCHAVAAIYQICWSNGYVRLLHFWVEDVLQCCLYSTGMERQQNAHC